MKRELFFKQFDLRAQERLGRFTVKIRLGAIVGVHRQTKRYQKTV